MNLIHGDCLEEMAKLPDNSIDLVLTDPPYKVISGGRSTGFSHKTGNIFSKSKDGQLFDENNISIFDWSKEIYRVLKSGTHIYTMTNNLNLEDTLKSFREVGFKFHNLLFWKKNNVLTNRWYMKNCEYILFFRKGKAKTINNKSTTQLLEFDNIRKKLHPTQKPVKLMELLIANSSQEGDTVLDPFMGSGSTGIACKNLHRDFIGIELDENYYNIAKERLQ